MNAPPMDHQIPPEPLALSAPLARKWAPQCCASHTPGFSCEPYHGLWQYLRLMGLAPALGGHVGIYRDAMAGLARQWDSAAGGGTRRILISGCADYAMLACVGAAFNSARNPPHITVLDICPTPLKLCEWYAPNLALPVETVCSDLLAHQAADAYDLIVTSSFLGFFSAAQRPGVFGAYSRMLRAGGSLMFSNRLRDGDESVVTGFSAAQTRTFADKVGVLSRSLPPDAPLGEEEARSLALAYVSLRSPFPVNSAETIRRLADGSGLRWGGAQYIHGDANTQGVSGPTLADGAQYLFVTLEKPG